MTKSFRFSDMWRKERSCIALLYQDNIDHKEGKEAIEKWLEMMGAEYRAK